MALALTTRLRVADITRIYPDVPRDYTLSELCIMSRFRPITHEDNRGLGRLFERHVLAIRVGTHKADSLCVQEKERDNKMFRALMFIKIPIQSHSQHNTLCWKSIQMKALCNRNALWIMKSFGRLNQKESPNNYVESFAQYHLGFIYLIKTNNRELNNGDHSWFNGKLGLKKLLWHFIILTFEFR